MTEDIQGYLLSKGLNLKQAGQNNVHTACVFCKEDEQKRGRLYINVDPTAEPPALFFCHLCGERGALNKLRKHFGDPIETDAPDDRLYKVHEAYQAAAQYYHECLSDEQGERAFQYLRKDRGLTTDTIIDHQLGWADGKLKQHLLDNGHKLTDVLKTGLIDSSGRDFLHRVITIPYHVNGNVMLIRGKEMGGKYLTPPGQKTRLYNSDTTWASEQTIIAEGEFDALVLEQLGYSAVGLPGANVWQPSWADYFTDQRKVHICLDPDPAGQAGAEKVAHSIGGKARIVKLPEAASGDPKMDITEFIVTQGHTREDFHVYLLRSRGGLLISVYDAYEQLCEMRKVPGIKMGWPKLDRAIDPGLRPSQIMIVLAKTGAGKTLWGINTFYRMIQENPGIKLMFITLEQAGWEWVDRACKIYRFYHPLARDQEALAFFQSHVGLVDKNRLPQEQLIEAVQQYEYEYGEKPQVVLVDYLGYWARAYKGEEYQRVSDAIMDLKALCKELQIICIAPHQVGRGTKFSEDFEADTGRGSGVIEETADFLCTIRSLDQQKGREIHDQTGEVILEIKKSRQGGTLTKQSVYLAPVTLAMIPEHDPLIEYQRHEHGLREFVENDIERLLFRRVTGMDDTIRNLPLDWEEQWEEIRRNGLPSADSF